MRVHTVQCGDRCLSYREHGAGEPVLLIGFGRYTYRLLSHKLTSRYRFVLHDYYGLFDRPSDLDLSLARFLEEIDTILSDLGIDSASIIGHSTSGTVALDYALTRPAKVRKLVLICSPIAYDRTYREFQVEYQRRNLVGARKEAFSESVRDFSGRLAAGRIEDYFRSFHAAQSPLYFHDCEYTPEDHWEGLTVNPDFIRAFADVYDNYHREGELADVAGKLLSVLGRSDFATPAESWTGHLTNEYVSIFERSGHYPMIEERERFDECFISHIG